MKNLSVRFKIYVREKDYQMRYKIYHQALLNDLQSNQ